MASLERVRRRSRDADEPSCAKEAAGEPRVEVVAVVQPPLDHPAPNLASYGSLHTQTHSLGLARASGSPWTPAAAARLSLSPSLHCSLGMASPLKAAHVWLFDTNPKAGVAVSVRATIERGDAG